MLCVKSHSSYKISSKTLLESASSSPEYQSTDSPTILQWQRCQIYHNIIEHRQRLRADLGVLRFCCQVISIVIKCQSVTIFTKSHKRLRVALGVEDAVPPTMIASAGTVSTIFTVSISPFLIFIEKIVF